MEKHPFRTAKESGSSAEKFAALFTPDVRFKSPIFVKPLVGQDIVLSVLLNAGEVIGARSYLDEFRQGDTTVLTWEGMVLQRIYSKRARRLTRLFMMHHRSSN